MHRRRVWPALVVALVAVVGAALLPLAPVQMSAPVVSWPEEPARPASTMLQLTAQQPSELDVSFSCAAARIAGGTPGGVLLSTLVPGQEVAARQGLQALVDDGRLVVTVRDRTLVDRPVPEGACRYRITGDPSGVTAERDGARIGRIAAPEPPDTGFPPGLDADAVLPDVDVLTTGIDRLPSDDDLRVRLVVDDQFNTVPSDAKLLLVAVVLVAAVASLVAVAVLERGGRHRTPRRRVPAPTRAALAVVDLAVVALLVLWTFLAPPTDDDGYYAAMARNASAEGFVGNYYQLLNQSFTPFTWFYRVLGWWDSVVGSSPVLLRVPALLVGIGTWWVLRRYLAQPGAFPAGLRSSRLGVPAAVVLAATGFLAWWLPYGMGVRPEAVVGFLAAAALLGVATGLRHRRLLPVALGFGAAGLAVACHPTGLVALAPFLVALPRLVRLVARGDGRVAALTRAALVLAPGAFAAAAAFADGTLNDFLRGQEIFLSVQEQEGWEDEYVRYSFLLGPIPMGNYAKRIAVLLALLALLWFLVTAVAIRARGRRLPGPLALAGATLAAAFLLLWFTPSKWTHHFGALAGTGAIFLALLLLALPSLVRRATGGRRPSPSVGLLAGGSVVVVLALAFRGPNSWPYSWLPGLPQADEAPTVAGLPVGSPLTWSGVALVLLALALLTRRGEGRPAVWPRVLPALVVIALATSLTYLLGGFAVAAARTVDGYSPWADALTDPLSRDCAAAGALRVPDLDAATALPLAGGPPGADGGGTFVPGEGWHPVGPPPDEPGRGVVARVWGSLAAPGAEDATGTLTTGWFELPAAAAGTRPVVLAAGRLDGGNRVRAEYAVGRPGQARVVGEQLLTDARDSPAWRTFLLDPPDGAPGPDLVRLVAEDRTGGPGGWLAVTGPSMAPVVPLAEYLPRDAPVAVAWQVAFLFPCQRQPVLRDGITEPPEYAVVWRSGPLGNGLDDNTWQDARGGQFGPVRRTSSVVELPAWLPDRPDVAVFQVFRFVLPYPVGSYDLEPARDLRPGWAGPPAAAG